MAAAGVVNKYVAEYITMIEKGEHLEKITLLGRCAVCSSSVGILRRSIIFLPLAIFHAGHASTMSYD